MCFTDALVKPTRGQCSVRASLLVQLGVVVVGGGVVMLHMAKGAEPDSHRDLKNREEGEDLCPSLYFIATVSENKTSYSHSAVRRSGTAVTYDSWTVTIMRRSGTGSIYGLNLTRS